MSFFTALFEGFKLNLAAFGKNPISTIIISAFIVISIVLLTVITKLAMIYRQEARHKR